MNEKIEELAEKVVQMPRVERESLAKRLIAEMIIEERIIDFYRHYLDTTSDEDITVQVERYIRDYVGGE